jgi:fructose-1,6-bisphosphatase/inositol monophosphatase family enzyme
MTDLAERRLKSAIKAAKAAGAIIRNRFGTDLQVDFKNLKDPVTEVDKACEDQIEAILTSEHPEIAFWGEESGTPVPNASLTWVVDPLDGTKNFIHGYPFVCVSIGLVRDSRPILGVVYDPIRDELFTAVEGGGAFLNGKPIFVSQTERMSAALVVTTLSTFPLGQGPLILKACDRCQGVRRGGAGALDLCQVAAGRLDAVWEWYLKPWDLAAAVILIQEAQGTVTLPDGSPFDLYEGTILATNTNLHKAFTDLILE